MKRLIPIVLIVIALMTAGVCSFKIFAQSDNSIQTFTVDVAHDANAYIQDSIDPLAPKDLFSRGDTGILDGTI